MQRWRDKRRQRRSFTSTVLAGGYDVGSGALTVDDSVGISLNQFGLYETVAASPSADLRLAEATSTMSDSRTADESELAAMLFGELDGVQHADVVGFHLGLYAGFVAEGDFRAKGSSGGFATWILNELLVGDHVDGVVHVAAAQDGDEVLFKYVISRSGTEIRERSKSRYYPVELSSVLHEVLEVPGRYAIVGIPSVLSEVRLLAENHPVIKQRIRFTVGLICGHQKSTKYAESFAWQCGIRPGDLRGFDFRKKRSDGPAWDYQMEMTGLVNGELVTMSRAQSELFGSDWGHGFFKARFSDFTDDALNETADISLGDAWLEAYDADSLGNNVLIVRDPTIHQIILDAIDVGRLHLDAVSVETVMRSQRGLVHHTRDELPYRLQMQDRRRRWRPRRRIEVAPQRLGLVRRLVQRARLRMAESSHRHYQRAVQLDDWSYFHRRMTRHVRWYAILYKVVALQKLARAEGKRSVLLKVVRKIRRSA